MNTPNSEDLHSQLMDAKQQLEKAANELEATKKAIWDMLNYANMFVLLLDSKMNVLLINQNFADKLGFKDVSEIIGRCWLDFVKKKDQDKISMIHHSLAHDTEEESSKYREVVNDIVRADGVVCTIKWFNFPINHEYNLTFSFGIPKKVPTKITEESIRSYYHDILEKDKTMILALRDKFIKEIKTPDKCEPDIIGGA